MPLPKPTEGESEKDFMGRCMKALSSEFDDDKQRAAVCYRQYRGKSEDMAYDLSNVEIFRPGTWNGRRYTESDIDDLVSSFDKLGYEPPIKLGHEEKSGDQAWGWVRNLRKVAGRAVADLADLPESLYNAIKEKRYNALSAEIFFDLKRDENVFRRALKAVALLGAEVPAVSGLKPLSAALSESDSFSEIVNVDIDEVLTMDELQKLKDENVKLASQVAELEKRKDLTDDVEQLTQKIALKESAISDAAAKIAALEDKLRNQSIAEKVAKVDVPSYREYFTALYSASKLDKVVKFGEGEKTVEQVLDDLVAQVNKVSSSLFKELGHGNGVDKPDERPDVAIARLIEKYQEEHTAADYFKAREVVFREHPDLAQAYIKS